MHYKFSPVLVILWKMVEDDQNPLVCMVYALNRNWCRNANHRYDGLMKKDIVTTGTVLRGDVDDCGVGQ